MSAVVLFMCLVGFLVTVQYLLLQTVEEGNRGTYFFSMAAIDVIVCSVPFYAAYLMLVEDQTQGPLVYLVFATLVAALIGVGIGEVVKLLLQKI